MAEKVKYPLATMVSIGSEFRALISPYCERVEIVGSIRRLKPEVGDIEILAEPLVPQRPDGLFGETVLVDLLDGFLHDLRNKGHVQDRPGKDGKGAFGKRFKRMVWKGYPVDLFSVRPPAQWGVLKVIRTGPADFSQRLVTAKPHGMMPMGMQVRDGAIWDRGAMLETPTEESVFEALGMGYIRPWERR